MADSLLVKGGQVELGSGWGRPAGRLKDALSPFSV